MTENIQNHPQALLINDLAGYGKVALSAMIPVLSHMGVNVYNLPTALVSNTLDYGKFDILDTTEYMKNTLHVWEELGFSFQAVSTGFIVNREQAGLVTEYCRKQSEKGVRIFCDPIMGDDGKLYNGMDAETVENMKRLVSCADYIVPNYTEAAFLTGMEYREQASEEEIREMIGRLRELGAKSVVVTSVELDGQHQVCGYDHRTGESFRIPFDYIPVRFPGTGDIFSAVMMGGILGGRSLEQSVKHAMDTVRGMILKNLENQDRYKGILIESCLEVLDEQA